MQLANGVATGMGPLPSPACMLKGDVMGLGPESVLGLQRGISALAMGLKLEPRIRLLAGESGLRGMYSKKSGLEYCSDSLQAVRLPERDPSPR